MCTEYHSRFCLISRGAGLTEALGQDREFQGRQSTTDDQRHEQECVRRQQASFDGVLGRADSRRTKRNLELGQAGRQIW